LPKFRKKNILHKRKTKRKVKRETFADSKIRGVAIEAVGGGANLIDLAKILQKEY
jgi:hypothetical protein